MENKEQQQKPEEKISAPGDFVRAARIELRNGDGKAAYKLIQAAFVYYPESPLIVSYFGCLQAIVDKKHKSGMDNCKKALAISRKEGMSGGNALYPVLYLNLGRACLAAKKKKEAVDSFQKGLQYDKRNTELLKEMQALGVRKKPIVSFLGRSNPINKYIGMLLHDAKNNPGKKVTVRKG